MNKIPNFTKKDFAFIASIITDVAGDGSLCMDSAADRIMLAEQFADRLAETNPLFDREKFIEAATFEEDRKEVEDEDYDPYA